MKNLVLIACVLFLLSCKKSSTTTTSANVTIKASIMRPYLNQNVVYTAQNGSGAYTWSFDDGTKVTGITATHSFATSGNHTVLLSSITSNTSAILHLNVRSGYLSYTFRNTTGYDFIDPSIYLGQGDNYAPFAQPKALPTITNNAYIDTVYVTPPTNSFTSLSLSITAILTPPNLAAAFFIYHLPLQVDTKRHYDLALSPDSSARWILTNSQGQQQSGNSYTFSGISKVSF